MLFERNENLASPDYSWAIDAWTDIASSPWIHTEISMRGDISDWNSLSEEHRKCIGSILKTFTIAEQRIGCYWRNLADAFPKADLAAMCTAFSFNETIHAAGYAYLSATLGLDEYAAFKQCEISQKKLSLLVNSSNLAESLATFSGAGEYVSLFASFLLLMSYCKEGQFKGLRQILSYSIREEQIHAKAAAKLFKEYSKEQSAPKPSKQWIAEMLETAKQNELAFIANAFAGRESINSLTLQDIELFINHRCNEAAAMLGYDRIYKEAKTQPWFDLAISLNNSAHTDFFVGARSSSGYSAKLSQDFGLGLANFASSLQAPQCDLSGQCS